MPLLSRCLALGLLLLATACGYRGSELDPKTGFAPGTDQAGLVVVGVAAERYNSFLGVTSMGSVSIIDLRWTKIEGGVAPEKPADRIIMRFRRRACEGDSLLPGIGEALTRAGADPCDMREMAWHVLRVQPGDYQLSEVGTLNVIHSGRQVYSTTRLADTAALVARVDAGEIVYLGDLTFDLVAGPARLVRAARNDEAAQRALAALPLVGKAEVIFRPMLPRERFLNRLKQAMAD